MFMRVSSLQRADCPRSLTFCSSSEGYKMAELQLKLTSFDAIPADLARLSEIAAEKGLSRSAFLRQTIHQIVLRAERAEKSNVR
jgi:hypothetical protein